MTRYLNAIVCRLALQATVLLWISGALVLAAIANFLPWFFLALIVGAVYHARHPRLPGWAHGTARWITADQLAKAKMLNGPGLILGRAVARPNLKEAVVYLFSVPWSRSEDAVQLFLAVFQN